MVLTSMAMMEATGNNWIIKMKLNSPFFNLSRSEGLAISNPHFYNKWQGWALAQNPLAYWNFNDTAGPFPDLTGRSSSVVPGSAMTLGVSGYVDGSLAIKGFETTGVHGYATAARTGAISGQPTALTIEALVRFDTLPGTGTPLISAARRGQIFTHGTAFTPIVFRLGTDAILHVGLQWMLNESTNEAVTADVVMSGWTHLLNTWYHIIMTADCTREFMVYINGHPTINYETNTPALYIVTGTTNPWTFCGQAHNGGAGSPHRLDEFIVYDRFFTAEEAAMRFAQTGLVDYSEVEPPA